LRCSQNKKKGRHASSNARQRKSLPTLATAMQKYRKLNNNTQPGVEPTTNSLMPQEANQSSYANNRQRFHAQTFLIGAKQENYPPIYHSLVNTILF